MEMVVKKRISKKNGYIITLPSFMLESMNRANASLCMITMLDEKRLLVKLLGKNEVVTTNEVFAIRHVYLSPRGAHEIKLPKEFIEVMGMDDCNMVKITAPDKAHIICKLSYAKEKKVIEVYKNGVN